MLDDHTTRSCGTGNKARDLTGTMVQCLINCSRRGHPGPTISLWEQAGCGQLGERAR